MKRENSESINLDEAEDSVDISMEENAENEDLKGKGVARVKRPRRSKWWQYYDILPKKEGEELFCKCKACGQVYKAASSYGTGNLQRHFSQCPRRQTSDIAQTLLAQGEKGLLMHSQKFSEEKFRELLISAIIRHELPFQFVEYEYIRAVFTYLQPHVTHITRNTAKADVLKMHKRAITRITDELRACPGRICFTSDLWTSIVTDGYLCLTAHYIDSGWSLQKRIISFSYMPPPHSGIALSEKIYNLLTTWGIERKVFTMTLDNAAANDVFVDVLRSQLSLKSPLVNGGKFLHVRCCAHILNLIVQEGLKKIDTSVDRIRECVKYVKGSQVRKQKFLDCVEQTSLDSKKALRQDVPTRWNSTYLMLCNALYYRRAFNHLRLTDSNFVHCPSVDEWDRVEKICNFLERFYNTTNIFSGVKYPTANLYFPQVFMIQLTLIQEIESVDGFMKPMATQMFEKFDKYWKEYSLLLAVAVIFDPRYKIQFVEWCYNKLYGVESNECKSVRETLFSLFDEYTRNAKKLTSSGSLSNFHGLDDTCTTPTQPTGCIDVLKEFDSFQSSEFLTSAQRSQLELYLDEPRFERNSKLDVLSFWKAHQFRYPELAQLARDILSVPISTVASESAFSTGGRILDQYRSALKPDVVEALVCCRDWMFGHKGSEQVMLEELTEDIMNLKIIENINDAKSSTVTSDGSSTNILDLDS